MFSSVCLSLRLIWLIELIYVLLNVYSVLKIDWFRQLPGFGKTDENKFKRKLSKREKKEQKKREKQQKLKASETAKDSLAEKLYTELPETSFTRSISNPEAVMRRRRQQKLEKKLQQFSQEGGEEKGQYRWS